MTWTIDDVAPNFSHELRFCATVDHDLGGHTSVSNAATFTNVATEGCVFGTCATGTVTKPAEPWALTQEGISPFND